MALNRKIKAPKVFQGTPGKEKRYSRSSTKQPKPLGIKPGKTAWGILNTSRGDQESLGARAAKMLGTGSRNTPTGQDMLTKKVKRQAY